MRKGILGGTFDPIHVAHLIIAEEARVRLALEEVVFIPAGQPWLKKHQPVSPAQLRLQMVQIAVASNPFFRVSSIEIDRLGPTYSVDTLEVLQEEWGKNTEVFFILGVDSLRELPKWKEPKRLLKLCTPAVFSRPEHGDMTLAELDELIPGASKKVKVLADPRIGVSGRDIRRRVARGISIRYLVPEGVERFILEHGLYAEEKGDG